MCKIYFSSAYDPARTRHAINRMIQTERDGSGVALVSPDGTVAIRRAGDRDAWAAPESRLAELLGSPQLPPPDPAAVIIGHARTATGPRSAINTHPLQTEDGSLLVHNGIVSSTTPLKRIYTDSWSLALLHQSTACAEDFAEAVAREITGSAAVIAYHQTRREYIIARGHGTRLSYHDDGHTLTVTTDPAHLTGPATEWPVGVLIVFDAEAKPLRAIDWTPGRFRFFETKGKETQRHLDDWYKTRPGTADAPRGRLAEHDAKVADEVARRTRETRSRRRR